MVEVDRRDHGDLRGSHRRRIETTAEATSRTATSTPRARVVERQRRCRSNVDASRRATRVPSASTPSTTPSSGSPRRRRGCARETTPDAARCRGRLVPADSGSRRASPTPSLCVGAADLDQPVTLLGAAQRVEQPSTARGPGHAACSPPGVPAAGDASRTSRRGYPIGWLGGEKARTRRSGVLRSRRSTIMSSCPCATGTPSAESFRQRLPDRLGDDRGRRSRSARAARP